MKYVLVLHDRQKNKIRHLSIHMPDPKYWPANEAENWIRDVAETFIKPGIDWKIERRTDDNRYIDRR